MLDNAISSLDKKYDDYILPKNEAPSQTQLDEFSSTISLTPTEESLFKTIENCIYDQKLDVQLRVAGGWVRDKLLGINSCDMDISIDKMTGEEFATVLKSWLSLQGYQASSIGIVSARPAQSKHLETATLTIFDQKIDFVNLRSEMYSENSRIPSKVIFGTPSEDAHRRDITINSLFFNIHTKKVEDWTGRGLRDLAARIIRTPLPPASIFMDDPLRILRTLRFASRFKYTIDPEIKSVICERKDIRNALQVKISRERIGIELKKMITGPNPFLSLSLIYDYLLWPCVFLGPLNFPSDSLESAGVQKKDIESIMVLQGWKHVSTLSKLLEKLAFPTSSNAEDSGNMGLRRIQKPIDPTHMYILYVASAILPSRGLTVFKPGIDFSGTVRLSEYICRYFLKTANSEETAISGAVESAEIFVEFMDKFGSHIQLPFNPLCYCLRTIGPRWEFSWILAQVIRDYRESQIGDIDSLDQLIREFSQLRTTIFLYGLDTLWTTRPLLNGSEIISYLGFSRGTSVVQRLLSELIVWQIKRKYIDRIPESSLNKDAAYSFLGEIYSQNPDGRFTNPTYPIKEF